MDSNKFMKVVSKHIDQNFDSNNQLVEYVVSELSSLDLNLNTEQAQHIVNIIEYVSKSTSKSTIVTLEVHARAWTSKERQLILFVSKVVVRLFESISIF